jgi:hypothetical protein
LEYPNFMTRARQNRVWNLGHMAKLTHTYIHTLYMYIRTHIYAYTHVSKPSFVYVCMLYM